MRVLLAATTTLALLLASCGPLVQIGGGADAPDSLLTVESSATAPATTTGDPVLFALPDVPGKLQTLRLPVSTGASEVQYLAGATWIEQPNRLFQRILADQFEASTGTPAIDEGNIDLAPAARISGTLMEFGLDVTGQPQVVVRYDAVMSRTGQGFAGARRFEAMEPVAAQSGPAVAAALGRAANRVAAEVATWAAGNQG